MSDTRKPSDTMSDADPHPVPAGREALYGKLLSYLELDAYLEDQGIPDCREDTP